MAFKDLLPELWRGGELSSPVREMSRLQRRIDHMFEDFFSEAFPSWGRQRGYLQPMAEFLPACDVEETDTNYFLSFDLPGVKKDDVKIELQENLLTISGERKREQKEEGKGRTSRERYYGSFVRSFTLPANVDPTKVQANYDNGVLQISIPKSEIAPGKQIPIKEGKLIETKAGKAA